MEKGKYNPSLTISFKIAEVLKRPFNEIFYQEPVIKDEIKKKTIMELEDFAKNTGIPYEALTSIGEISEKELSNKFDRDFLEKVSEFLGKDFDYFFIDAEI